MYIYFILILLWVGAYSLSLKLEISYRKIFSTVLFGLTLFLVMALRDKSVGVDVERYLELYTSKSYLTSESYYRFEYGFHGYMRLLSGLGFNGQAFIITTSLVIAIAFSRFFYKYSDSVFLSFYLHLTIGLFIITMSALRQSMAICVLLYSIDFIVKRRFVLFLLLVYIASTFHFTAICFFPVYFLYNVKLKSYNVIIILLLLIFSLLFFKDFLLTLSQKVIPHQYSVLYGIYRNKVRMNVLLAVIAFAIPVFIVIIWKVTNQDITMISRTDSFLFLMTCASTVITILALDFIIIERISYYFIPSYVVLLPNVLSRLNLTTNRLMIYGTLMFVCLLYFIFASVGGVLEISHYRFFFT